MNAATGRMGDIALREPKQATGPVTAANSLENTVLSASRQRRNVAFASFFFAVIIQEASRPQSPAPSSVSGHPFPVPKGGRRSGAKEGGSPRAESFPGDSQIWRFFCLPFPRGRLRRGCKNLGARSLACQEANCLHILQEQHPCLGRGRKRQNK